MVIFHSKQCKNSTGYTITTFDFFQSLYRCVPMFFHDVHLLFMVFPCFCDVKPPFRAEKNPAIFVVRSFRWGLEELTARWSQHRQLKEGDLGAKGKAS